MCDDLIQGQMVHQLLALMDQAPERWRKGVVVIRIGVNDVSTNRLDHVGPQWTRTGPDGQGRQLCQPLQAGSVDDSGAAPATRIVLVGLFDNSHWAPLTSQWQDAESMRQIAMGLKAFNGPLRQLAASHPSWLSLMTRPGSSQTGVAYRRWQTCLQDRDRGGSLAHAQYPRRQP